MNYLDYGKTITEDVLKKSLLGSSPRDISDVAGFWKEFFSDDMLIGIVDRAQNHYGGTTEFPIIAPVNGKLFKKKSNGLYIIEGAQAGCVSSDVDILGSILAKDVPFVTVLDSREPFTLKSSPAYSRLALPSEKIIPLYVNKLFGTDIRNWVPIQP